MAPLRTEWVYKGWKVQFSSDDIHYLVVSPLKVIVQRFVCCTQAVTYAEVLAQEDFDERDNYQLHSI